jgi:hypothetical protein
VRAAVLREFAKVAHIFRSTAQVEHASIQQILSLAGQSQVQRGGAGIELVQAGGLRVGGHAHVAAADDFGIVDRHPREGVALHDRVPGVDPESG